MNLSTTKKGLLVLALLMAMCVAIHAQQIDSANAVRSSTGNALTVTGNITEASGGKPLPGIRVGVEGFSSALTDDKGHFVLKVQSYSNTLVISGQGYQNKEVALKGRKAINAALNESGFISLYNQAVLPYGNMSLSRTAHAVSSVNTSDHWERPTETPDSYLQGQVSGLNVIRRSGTPGIGANLFLRGFSSLHATNQPLVVVDGMLYDTGSYGSSLIGGHLTNPLSDIDIKDIDNITVIKDGASFYGSRGANGVLLITTAHASEFDTRIDFSAYGGMNSVPQKIPVMKKDDYRLYLSDILRSSGLTDSQIQAQPYMNDDRSNPDYSRYHYSTDWQDKVLDNSYNQNYYLKVTGGDNIARYALSVGYLNANSITEGTNLKRYNTRFNADLNLSPKLSANTNLSFTTNEQILKDQGSNYNTNPILLSLIKSPFLPEREVADNGIESPNLADADIFNVSNPVSLIEDAQQSDKNYRFNGSIKFNYTLGRHSSIGSLTGLTFDKIRENTFLPRLGIAPDTLANALAFSKLGSRVQRYYSLYNNTWFAYKRSFTGGHNFSGNVGFRYNNSESEQDYGLGYNSPTDEFVSIGNGVTSLRQINGDIGKWRWLNTYMALDYQYLSKYLLSVNVAVDGSSRFGKDIPGALTFNTNEYAVLPSIAAGWVISSENFMQRANLVDLLKVRASYGITGNEDISNYSGRQYYVSQNLLGNQGLIRGNIANPSIQWESNRKANLGIDAAFLNERISVSIDVYHNQTSKMITYEPLRTGAGFDYVISNNGGMKSSGIEIGLNTRLLNKKLKLDMGLTVASYKNQITSLPGDRMLTQYGGATILTETGRPASQFYGYTTIGIFSSDAEAAGANLNTRMANGSLLPFKAGDVHFADLNNDHVIDGSDRSVIGDPNPDFFGALNARLAWKSFSLDAVFSFSANNDIYNQPRSVLEALSSPYNQTENALNRWRTNGQITNVPKASYGDPAGNARFSDRWIEDGSYLRLRNLSLTYNLPVKPKFLRYATVYATSTNLFTLTNYLGYDPEFSPGGSPLAQGIDTALEPQFRSVQLGVRIGL